MVTVIYQDTNTMPLNNTNELKKDNIADKQIKFYEKNSFMWLTLVLFAPVGIFLMWKNKKFSRTTRKVISGIFALWFIFVAIGKSSNNNSNGAENKTVQTSESKAKTTEEIKKEADDKANAEAESKNQRMKPPQKLKLMKKLIKQLIKLYLKSQKRNLVIDLLV